MHTRDMPKPTDMIEYSDGACGVAFLHYIGEGTTMETARIVAAGHGYALTFLDFWDDVDEDDPLGKAQMDGENVIARWSPNSPDEGWQFAGKWDTEDGPTSAWIKQESYPHRHPNERAMLDALERQRTANCNWPELSPSQPAQEGTHK